LAGQSFAIVVTTKFSHITTELNPITQHVVFGAY